MTIIIANIAVLFYSRLFPHSCYNATMQPVAKFTAALLPLAYQHLSQQLSITWEP
jgi:hypothetical protein